MLNSIYETLYTLLVDAIFGGVASVSIYGEFFCEGIAIIACAFLVSLPFLIVWRVIRRFV